MRIGELAERTQTPVDTIRYYERSGLLPAPVRTSSNYRAYAASQVERLSFIRRCRSLDMSLEEVRTLLAFCDQPTRHCDAVNQVLDDHIRHVEERVKQLQRLTKELRQLRGVCRAPGSSADCQILNRLRSDPPVSRKATHAGHRPRAGRG